jgi:hypothetical protein
MILAALAISFIKGEKAIGIMCKTMRWYFAVTLTIVTLLVIGEFYYYDNFETRYNIVFFDFLDLSLEFSLSFFETCFNGSDHVPKNEEKRPFSPV